MGVLAKLGSLRLLLTLVTAITAAYFILLAFGNITDFGTNQQFVKHVLAMDTTFKDPDVMWRAVTSPALANLCYLGIVAWESLTALVLIGALVLWIRALAGRGGFELARRLSTLGWSMSVLLFAGGFIVVGGEWFEMWQSKTWNGLQPALQNFIIAVAALILVHLPDRSEGSAS